MILSFLKILDKILDMATDEISTQHHAVFDALFICSADETTVRDQ